MKRPGRKALIRICSYVLALILTLTGFAYQNYVRAEEYKLQVEQGYQQAFTELVNSLNNIESSLQKSQYTNSPALILSICSDIQKKVTAAEMSIGALPFSTVELEQTSTFINRIGDYAYYISKKTTGGTPLTAEELSNLQALAQTAQTLGADLNQLQMDINQGYLSFSEIKKAAQTLGDISEKTLPGGITTGVQSIEEEFPEIPTLIYDGPFSEHIEKMEPELLKGEPELGAEECAKKAAAFFNTPESAIQYIGENNGKIKTHMFSANSNGDELFVEVTRQGGYVLNAFSSRPIYEISLEPEQCVEAAREFLESNGFDNLRESYWIANDGTVTINFAYEQDGIICYSDLIRVDVARDTGEITGIQAEGYIMSHKNRSFPEVQISSELAHAGISKQLKVLSNTLALIPTDGKYEMLCHEIKCETETGGHCIVYVNAQTGADEKILILIEDENGTLTI